MLHSLELMLIRNTPGFKFFFLQALQCLEVPFLMKAKSSTVFPKKKTVINIEKICVKGKSVKNFTFDRKLTRREFRGVFKM